MYAICLSAYAWLPAACACQIACTCSACYDHVRALPVSYSVDRSRTRWTLVGVWMLTWVGVYCMDTLVQVAVCISGCVGLCVCRVTTIMCFLAKIYEGLVALILPLAKAICHCVVVL